MKIMKPGITTATVALILTACSTPAHRTNDRTVYLAPDGQLTQTMNDPASVAITCNPNISKKIVWLDRATSWPDTMAEHEATRLCRISAAMRW